MGWNKWGHEHHRNQDNGGRRGGSHGDEEMVDAEGGGSLTSTGVTVLILGFIEWFCNTDQ